MKKLIDVAYVNNLQAEGKTVVYVDDNTLITPAARDRIVNLEMKIENGTEPEAASEPAPAPTPAPAQAPVTSDVVAAPAAASNCDTVDCGDVDVTLMLKVLAKLQEKGLLNGLIEACKKDSKPYSADYDDAGFKLIHGNTVQMEMLDTGNPSQNGKVNYQEIIGSDDGSNLGCGFITIDNVNFDWLTECQEVYYIVSGVITVTINGKVYEAHPGDSFFIKKGISCQFGAQGLGKAFYATF